MTPLPLRLLPLLALVQAADDCVGSCPDGWKLHEDHCYLFVEDQDLTWDAAEARCVGEGGHLASITSESIKGFVKETMLKSVWTGARRRAGEEWSWADGSPWSYEAWAVGEPSTDPSPGGNCGKLGKIDDMEDRSCEGVARFVCSRKYCPGLSTGATVGIVAGVLVLVGAGGAGAWYKIKNKM